MLPEKPLPRHQTQQIRCWLPTTRPSRDSGCSALAGISIRTIPSREARSSRSVASATRALPAPRFGWTQAQIPTSFCWRTQSLSEAVHRSRSCEATWLRRQPRPCASKGVAHIRREVPRHDLRPSCLHEEFTEDNVCRRCPIKVALRRAFRAALRSRYYWNVCDGAGGRGRDLSRLSAVVQIRSCGSLTRLSSVNNRSGQLVAASKEEERADF